jgi:hypothetical protein
LAERAIKSSQKNDSLWLDVLLRLSFAWFMRYI